ncbi:DUF2768 domain-containing protein [Lysinibacillus xylanilyticus]|uniref:DUF2768 domain-containing protein n=1 Tax=Lysinibacillus xylanilyticus TaxID=582475 RepID=A0ABT4EQ39_9BACI|nr:DUF2768 domain-containing protein [Lysinibacillus xylanilyticus]MCY9547798.1 DUF2768 domain-containing protein [Lysinibacillus xylanilyticus]MED3802695.1 DUF2768 domain-containing protein [Lysinibacillus xylanilyticus]
MGPLAHLPALDVMWVSFYCIGFLIISVGLIYLARNKVSNGFLRTIVNLIAYILFGLGTFLMVLIVATWPA